MKKIISCILFIAACNSSDAKPTPAPVPAPKPAPVVVPRNFVCERVKRLNDKATCEPEYSDEVIHRAVVTVEKEPLSCALGQGQLSIVCGPLFMVVKEPEPQPKESPKKSAPAKQTK